MKNSLLFINRCFDKRRLKNFILWFFQKYGENETIKLLESLKKNGFKYATKAGVSIGIDDLQIPPIKTHLITKTEKNIESIEIFFQQGNLTEIERQQQIVTEWSSISDKLKYYVIQFFKATDIFNPIYMMAFSGARGNISQVRQLIGMRGLMSDPQGQILDFPIRSNFREGLTLTEYLISCYGARKGVVDTALRTATSGYLTRRLVDVAQQVVIGQQNCYTSQGMNFKNLIEGHKTILSLKDRLIGRVLMENIFNNDIILRNKTQIGFKNQEISSKLALQISQLKSSVFIRSPLTCKSKNSICQLCYGWSLSYGTIVSIGEAVGVLAAQSIGEPGTQLTMRTFHTGGVFTGSVIDRIYAPFKGKIGYLNFFQGVLVRTLYGKIGFLTKTSGSLQVKKVSFNSFVNKNLSQNELTQLQFSRQAIHIFNNKNMNNQFLKHVKKFELQSNVRKNIASPSLIFNIPIYTTLFTRQSESVNEKALIAELSSFSTIKNQQQEVEQEVFATNSGQVFFENLLLIEKLKRNGSIQNVTYGLGSIWVAAATIWNSVVNGTFFPQHGDFITISSTAQKFQIVPEQYYCLDLNFSQLIQKLNSIKKNLFSISLKNYYSTTKQFNDFFLSRKNSVTFFYKIYYQNYRYFIWIHFKNWFYILNCKNYRSSLNKIKILVGLNFSINKPISLAVSPHTKIMFGSISNFSKIKNIKYYLHVNSINFIKSKNQKPVISRKNLINSRLLYFFWFQLINLKIQNNSYWNLYSINKKIYKKTAFDLEFFKFHQKKVDEYSSLFNLNFKNFINKKNTWILKNFFKLDVYYKFYINWTSDQRLKLESILKAATPCQLVYNSINRQGQFKLTILKSFQLNKSFNNYYDYIINKFSSTYYKKQAPRLTKYSFIELIQSPILEKIYETKKVNKIVVLLHHKILDELYIHKKNFINNIIHKIINYFYINTYSLPQLRNNCLKIGIITKFKIQIFPNLYHLSHNNHFKFEKNNLFLIKSKYAFRSKNIFRVLKNIYFETIQSQNFSHWISTYSEPINFKFFNCTINYGANFLNNVYFDNQKVIIDLAKHNFSHLFNNKVKKLTNIILLKNNNKRFCISSEYSTIFAIYQKTSSLGIKKTDYSKKIFLRQQLYNFDLFNFLVLNKKNIYSNNFQKRALRPKQNLTLFSFDVLEPKFNNNLFTKNVFFEHVKIYINFNNNCRILFNFYSNINLNKNKIKNSNYTSILVFLAQCSEKNFYLSLIKKFKIPQIQSNRKQPLLKLFYYSSDFLNFKQFFIIKFFINLKNGEVLYTKYQNKINYSVILMRSDLKRFKVEKFKKSKLYKSIQIGNFIRYGNKIDSQKVINYSGQIIHLDNSSLVLRYANPFLVTSKSLLNVYQNSIVKAESRLFTFLYSKIKTGDIIQGIPRIEEFFEARATRDGIPLATNLHIQLENFFKANARKFSLIEATQKSFELIQQIIIDEVQKIYCSQGIYIADKHLEIVIRQMTSKVQIIEGGKTGLLYGELIEFDWVQLIHTKLSNYIIKYKPIVLGITKSCLETESFIAAASFQETTRILAKAAIQNKIDFIRGLKQNVVLGNLVPAGTGFFSPIYFKYLKIE